LTARRILVVDDNPHGATALKIGLELLGHTVEIAHDGDSALAVAATFRPEVALVDLCLPGMNGYELGRKLRERHALRLIAVTGYGDDDDIAHSRAAGFDDHIVKPFDLQVVDRVL
jgi:DNA-binding response OmpR family regulator